MTHIGKFNVVRLKHGSILLVMLAFCVVFTKQVLRKIVLEIPIDRVDMVRIVLGVIVLDQ